MSHISQAKTEIKNPDLNLLRQAVSLVAGEKQGRVTDYYLDWYHKSIPTGLAIFVPGMQLGMAVEVDAKTGELKFVGDFWGVEQLAKEVQQAVVQTYTSLVAMEALKAMGYVVEAQAGENGQLILTGVQYA